MHIPKDGRPDTPLGEVAEEALTSSSPPAHNIALSPSITNKSSLPFINSPPYHQPSPKHLYTQADSPHLSQAHPYASQTYPKVSHKNPNSTLSHPYQKMSADLQTFSSHSRTTSSHPQITPLHPLKSHSHPKTSPTDPQTTFSHPQTSSTYSQSPPSPSQTSAHLQTLSTHSQTTSAHPHTTPTYSQTTPSDPNRTPKLSRFQYLNKVASKTTKIAKPENFVSSEFSFTQKTQNIPSSNSNQDQNQIQYNGLAINRSMDNLRPFGMAGNGIENERVRASVTQRSLLDIERPLNITRGDEQQIQLQGKGEKTRLEGERMQTELQENEQQQRELERNAETEMERNTDQIELERNPEQTELEHNADRTELERNAELNGEQRKNWNDERNNQETKIEENNERSQSKTIIQNKNHIKTEREHFYNPTNQINLRSSQNLTVPNLTASNLTTKSEIGLLVNPTTISTTFSTNITTIESIKTTMNQKTTISTTTNPKSTTILTSMNPKSTTILTPTNPKPTISTTTNPKSTTILTSTNQKPTISTTTNQNPTISTTTNPKSTTISTTMKQKPTISTTTNPKLTTILTSTNQNQKTTTISTNLAIPPTKILKQNENNMKGKRQRGKPDLATKRRGRVWLSRNQRSTSREPRHVCDSDPCGKDAACHPYGDMTNFICICDNGVEVQPHSTCIPDTVDEIPSPPGNLSPSEVKRPYNVMGAAVAISVLVMAAMIVVYWRRKTLYALLRPLHGNKKHRHHSPGSIAKSSSLLTYNLASNPNYYTTTQDSHPLHTLSVHLIHPEQISFIGELGEGCFGKVYKGTYGPCCPENGGLRMSLESTQGDEHPEGDGEEGNVSTGVGTVSTTVAVKVLKESAGDEAEVDFLREVEIMSTFTHKNILSLIGIVAKGTGGTPWMVFEYMPYGDLADVLRSCNKETRNQTTSVPTLNQDDLLHISVQIASGMEYLSSQHFVHRDLACRNCLVGSNLTVKISDFGMSRDVYTCDYYKVGGSRMLPVRWMAVESIKYGKFTLESDVWSFGVVLWEIYSFGTQPYYGNSNENVIKLIFQGILLSPPDTCPPQVCDVMRRCWATEPNDRLKFTEILDLLQHIQSGPKTRASPHTIPPITYSELCLNDETAQLDADQYLVPRKVEPHQYITVLNEG